MSVYRRRRALLAWAYGLILVTLAWPVLSSPLWGDDIHWLLETTPRSQGTVEGWWRWTVARPWAPSPDQGRFVQVAYVVQRAFDHMTLTISVLFGTSPVIFRALLKLVLLALSVGALAFLLRQVRVADGAGTERRVTGLSVTTVRTVIVTFPLVLVLGTKATLGSGTDANGWLDYPLLTYTGASLLFLSVALFLRALRKWPSASVLWRMSFHILAVLGGLLLVLTYELFYLVVPAVAMALAVQPTGDALWSRAWWRTRAVVSLPFFGAFTALFLATRWYGSRACAQVNCYDGMTVSLRDETGRVILRSILSALPGGIRDEVAHAREYSGAHLVTWPALTAVAFLLGVCAVAAIWWITGDSRCRLAEGAAGARDRRILVRVALSGLAFGVAAAALTAVSDRGHRELDEIGIAYRSGPMAWSLFSVALVCFGAASVLALREWRLNGLGRAAVIAAGLALVAGTVLVWPVNIDAQRVDKSYPDVQLVRMIHDEVIYGRTDRHADDDRCALMARIYTAEFRAKSRMAQGAHESFMYYYGEPFCSVKTKDWAEPLEFGEVQFSRS